MVSLRKKKCCFGLENKIFCLQSTVEAFKKERKLESFGIPSLVAHGSCKINKSTFHFSIRPRFGRSIYDLFMENECIVPIDVVNRTAAQIVRNKIFL